MTLLSTEYSHYLAPYASHSAECRGRLVVEEASPTRSEYQRDRDRIIHSTAFRRLKHKTQVFIADEGDHYRTRLTHSIEVAQIARTLARAFRVDEDLTEAIALAHDFGHTPFGHAGERALNNCMKNCGGFDHNLQSLRMVSLLEKRYPRFDGLNLTLDTLEGLAKHNGPVPLETQKMLPAAFVEHLNLDGFAGIEAQIAAIADDIAYNSHDIDDGLRSELIKLDDLASVPLLAALIKEIEFEYPNLDPERSIDELSRRLITRMVEDVLSTGAQNIRTLSPQNIGDIKAARKAMIEFSVQFSDKLSALRRFLFAHLYRHPALMKQMEEAEIIINYLFEAYSKNPAHLPQEWQIRPEQANEPWPNLSKLHHISDYIAGMTDFFARSEYERLKV